MSVFATNATFAEKNSNSNRKGVIVYITERGTKPKIAEYQYIGYKDKRGFFIPVRLVDGTEFELHEQFLFQDFNYSVLSSAHFIYSNKEFDKTDLLKKEIDANIEKYPGLQMLLEEKIKLISKSLDEWKRGNVYFQGEYKSKSKVSYGSSSVETPKSLLVTKSEQIFYDSYVTSSDNLMAKIAHKSGVVRLNLDDLPESYIKEQKNDSLTKNYNAYLGSKKVQTILDGAYAEVVCEQAIPQGSIVRFVKREQYIDDIVTRKSEFNPLANMGRGNMETQESVSQITKTREILSSEKYLINNLLLTDGQRWKGKLYNLQRMAEFEVKHGATVAYAMRRRGLVTRDFHYEDEEVMVIANKRPDSYVRLSELTTSKEAVEEMLKIYEISQPAEFISKLEKLIIPEINTVDVSLSDLFSFIEDQILALNPQNGVINIKHDIHIDDLRNLSLSLKNIPLTKLFDFISILTETDWEVEKGGIIFKKNKTALTSQSEVNK